jgi:hypothetical protein
LFDSKRGGAEEASIEMDVNVLAWNKVVSLKISVLLGAF